MPTFRFPDDFKDHKSYVVLLKKALLQVKGETPKKFLYFKQYAFGAKKLPLVLVDYDLNCVGVLNKAGVKPTDEGMVSLTAQDELNFEAKKGALKRIRIKKYFTTMGSGIKPVFVPEGEVDDEEEGQGVPSAAPAEVGEALPPPPSEPLPPSPPKPTQAVQPEAPAQPAPPAPNPAMQRKLEFEQKQFALRARVKKVGALPAPGPLEALKVQALKKVEALIAAGKFADATMVLDQLEKKLTSGPPNKPAPTLPADAPALGKQMEKKMEFEEREFQKRELAKRLAELTKQAVPKALEAAKKQALTQATALNETQDFAGANAALDQFAKSLKAFTSAPPQKPPPSPPQPEVAKERKLSTYLNLNKEWDVARKSAAAELQRLEKVIAAACDGEPVKDLVFKKLPQLHTLVLKIDARLSDALSAGAKATDPDKQLDLDKETRKLVGEYRGTLRGHPLAAVVDENPFGSFKVMQTLEGALAKIEAEFN